jgi:hypothetical protein
MQQTEKKNNRKKVEFFNKKFHSIGFFISLAAFASLVSSIEEDEEK